MRIIKSLDDVRLALRDLENAIAEFRGKTWDLNQRRITNVHPSRDEYDVVVRKELGFTPSISSDKNIVSTQEDFDICTFGCGINTNIVVGYDIYPPYISPFNGTFVKCFAVSLFPATGQNLIFDIMRVHSGVTSSIFTSSFQMVAGDYSVQTTSNFAIASISEGDLLRLSVSQVGSANPGSMVVIKLKIRKV